MYGKKAVYFNYKTYGAFIVLLLLPALFLLGGASTLLFSPYPMLFGLVFSLVGIIPGLPRLMAINANINLSDDKVTKALKKAKRARKLLLAPVSIHIFTAYLMVLKSDFYGAAELLKSIEKKEMSFSEKSKYDSIKALLVWQTSGNPKEGLKVLEKRSKNDADESVYYATGKLLNVCDDVTEARKYNEAGMGLYQNNRGIIQNLVVSYCRTQQVNDAKMFFRNLYYDMGGPTIDSLYYMAKLKVKENKKKDAVEFIKKALEIESVSTDVIDTDGMKVFLNEIVTEEL